MKTAPTPKTVQAAAQQSAKIVDAHSATENALENEMSVLRAQMKRNQVLHQAEQAKLSVINKAIESGELL